MSAKDWRLNWHTVCFNRLVTASYVAMPNSSGVGGRTLIFSGWECKARVRKRGEREEPKTVTHFTHWLFMENGNIFFHMIPCPQTLWCVHKFQTFSVIKVRKNTMFVSESASHGKGSRFHLFWSLELDKRTLLQIFVCFGGVYLLFLLCSVMHMLIHKGNI